MPHAVCTYCAGRDNTEMGIGDHARLHEQDASRHTAAQQLPHASLAQHRKLSRVCACSMSSNESILCCSHSSQILAILGVGPVLELTDGW